jgi:hypothetical protein
LLFDTIEFEDDAELAARDALEHQRPLGSVRGATPSLRAAFGYALGRVGSRDIPLSMRELTPHVLAIAEQGLESVRAIAARLTDERRHATATQRLREALASLVVRDRAADPMQRADDVLEAAGARMLSARRIGGGAQLDVTYEIDGERIMSIVDIDTFQVIDPGVCLAGEHRVLTLDAMPSVVREAIAEDHLNITRHQCRRSAC